MTKIRGFKLGKHLHRVTRFFFLRKPTTTRPGYRHLIQTSSSSPQSNNYKPISKLLTWTRQLTSGAKSLCCSSRRRPGSGYMQLGDEEELPKPVTSAVPKGQLAVYVGQKDGDCRRVLVPVIYFNHPLFGELLKEAEMEFGFKHPGGITIPCPISDFENVKTRIENGSGQRRLARWKSS